MIYLELILGFLQVGMFSIGGGYAAIPLIREQALSHGWLSLAEFTDLVTIAEMTPGPIALNAATFVGIRTGGIPGALLATFSCILPSLIIVTTLAMLYQKFRKTDAMQVLLSGVRPAVVALHRQLHPVCCGAVPDPRAEDEPNPCDAHVRRSEPCAENHRRCVTPKQQRTGKPQCFPVLSVYGLNQLF